MEEICDDFKSSHLPVEGALLPAEYGAILRDGGESPLYLPTSFYSSSFIMSSYRAITPHTVYLEVYVPG